MIERAEQDLRKDIISLRDSNLNGRSLGIVADAMQLALNRVLNPAPPVQQANPAPPVQQADPAPPAQQPDSAAQGEPQSNE